MLRNEFVSACLAVVMGMGSGMLLSVGGQKLLNEHYKKTCHERPRHNLVLTRGFLGDTYYCIDSKYLVN